MTDEQLIGIRSRIISILEKRFLSPQNVLYDYAGMNGEVILPTPEECDESKPNSFSWHTPVSNGAFFNGDLLLALMKSYEKYPSDEVAAFARSLLKGLFALQDNAPVPGFICRGFGSDGKCCYLCSSNDQIIPFLLGLHAFGSSSCATEAERAECRRRILKLTGELKDRNYLIPGAKPGFERGDLKCKSPFDACHIMLIALLLEKYAGEKGIAEEMLSDRLEILGKGYPEMKARECWYSSHNFYILRMLKEHFANTPYAELFAAGLEAAAEPCSEYLELWKKRVPDNLFSPDWHCMNAVWVQQKCCADTLKCISLQGPIWRETSPAVLDERTTVMSALSAAWILTMAGSEKQQKEAMPRIFEALSLIPYEKLYHCSMFFAVNVVSELLDQPSSQG